MKEKKVFVVDNDIAGDFIEYMYNHKDFDKVYDGLEGEFISGELDTFIAKYEKERKIKINQEKLLEAIDKKLGK